MFSLRRSGTQCLTKNRIPHPLYGTLATYSWPGPDKSLVSAAEGRLLGRVWIYKPDLCDVCVLGDQ